MSHGQWSACAILGTVVLQYLRLQYKQSCVTRESISGPVPTLLISDPFNKSDPLDGPQMFTLGASLLYFIFCIHILHLKLLSCVWEHINEYWERPTCLASAGNQTWRIRSSISLRVSAACKSLLQQLTATHPCCKVLQRDVTFRFPKT